MMVSPSKPQPVVVAVVPNDNGLYEVEAVSMFMYNPDPVSRIDPEMMYRLPLASGPSTGIPPIDNMS